MSDKEKTELRVRVDLPGQALSTLAPRDLGEAMEFSKLIAQSGIVPKDYQGKPANVLVAIQLGMELGLAPMQAMQSIAVINGRPSVFGDGMLAICMAHPAFIDIQETGDDEGATCTVRRRGREPVTHSFSKADAKFAGLLNKDGPWKQYPRRMMQMRARAFALRDCFPDALRGIACYEEVGDFERDMGEAQVVEETPPQHSHDMAKQTRSEKVKARVQNRRRKAQEPPEPQPEGDDQPTAAAMPEPEKKDNPALLKSFIFAMDKAPNLEALKAAIKEIDSLSDADKEKARDVYKIRVEEFREAADKEGKR